MVILCLEIYYYSLEPEKNPYLSCPKYNPYYCCLYCSGIEKIHHMSLKATFQLSQLYLHLQVEVGKKLAWKR